MRRSLTRKLAIPLVALLITATGGCSDRRKDAEAIQHNIAQMTGVSSTDLDYTFNITMGQTFRLGVALKRDVTESQATDIGRAFVTDRHRGKNMGGDLVLSYPDGSASAPSGLMVSPSTPNSAAFDFDNSDAPDTDGVAHTIALWLRATRMPGHVGVQVTEPRHYDREDRNISITVLPDTTPERAVALGLLFTHARRGHPLPGKWLNKDILVFASQGDEKSSARFDLTPTDPSDEALATGITSWLHTVQSPAVESVYLQQPPDERTGGPGVRDIHVYLTPDATEATTSALQRSDPALAGASWTITVVRDKDAAYHRTDDYTSTPRPPSDKERGLWSQISDVVGKYYEVSGTTHPPGESDQAPTTVKTAIDRSADTEADVHRIASGLPPLLSQFGRPAALELKTPDGHIEIVVGGCYRHEPDHTRLPLEVQLSREYETC